MTLEQHKTVLSIIAAGIVLLMTTIITYSFFSISANNDQRQYASIETGTMRLTFSDNDM